MSWWRRVRRSRRGLLLASATALLLCFSAAAGNKVKLYGYLTARADGNAVMILDDRLEMTAASKVTGTEESGEKRMEPSELAPGQLVEVDGVWLDRHKFFAEKIVVDLRSTEKEQHGSAYLQDEPPEAAMVALKADGYWLDLGANTRRDWDVAKCGATGNDAGGKGASTLSGCHLKYTAVRESNGRMAAEMVELGEAAPADAYKLPHDLEVRRGSDPQTGIAVLEFRRGDKVQGRIKLLAVKSVEDYVVALGNSLLPAGSRSTRPAIEFRFFVVEDPSINAESLPDGTLLIHTGLLGAIENEAQLAFVLSHEISHVLQVHYWREVHETRAQRVSLIVAGVAAGALVGDVGVFMAGMGVASVVNGHQRDLENQADRLGLQNVIEHGYDAREAPRFSQLVIDRYGDRSSSRIWSNHDSSLMRGSFLTVQLQKEYAADHFEGAVKNTKAFRAMKEELGPVKIQ
jgi:hypothetical protein